MANTIKIDVLADVRDINKGIKDVNGKLDGFGKSVSKVGSALKTAFVAGAAAVAGAGLVNGLKSSITAASDLNETVSKTQSVFGSASKDIIAFANNAAKGLGLSKNEALAGAAQFGNLFDQLKIGKPAAAAMSKQFLTMSSDLASFNNADPSQVMDAFISATRGEFDALQTFIPTINAASIETEALALSQKKSAKQLTESDKVMALNSLSLKGMGKASGDFQRTSGGLANQQRILSARFKDLQADIGQKLLPVALKAVTFFGSKFGPVMDKAGGIASKLGNVFTTQVLPKIKEFGSFIMSTVVPAGKNLAAILVPLAKDAVSAFVSLLPPVKAFGSFLAGTVVPAVVSFTGFLKNNATAVQAIVVGVTAAVVAFKAYQLGLAVAGAATKAYTAVQAALNVVMALNPIGIVVLALVAIAAALVFAYKKSETFRNIVNGAFNAVKTGVVAVVNFFKALPGNISKAVGNLGTLLKTKGVSLIKGFITGYIGAYVAVAKFFGGLALKVLGAIGNLAGTLVRKGADLINGLAKGYNNAIGAVASFFRGIAGRVLSAIGNLGRTLYSHGADLVQGLINGIAGKAGALLQKARDLAGSIKKTIGDALKIGSPSKVMIQYGKWVSDGLAIGMQNVSGVKTAATGMAKAVEQGFTAPQLAIDGADGGTGGTVIHIHLEGSTGLSEIELTRRIQDALAKGQKYVRPTVVTTR